MSGYLSLYILLRWITVIVYILSVVALVEIWGYNHVYIFMWVATTSYH